MKLRIGRRTFDVADFAEASRIYAAERDSSGRGASTMPAGILPDGYSGQLQRQGLALPAARVDACRLAGVRAMSAPALTWRDIDDVLGIPGWGLRVGFTVEREPGDAPSVSIHEAEINTGHRVIDLCSRDLPNVVQLEQMISEALDVEDSQASFELSHPDRRDDGDYSFDRANEKRHEREQDDALPTFVDAMTRGMLA
jgi:hypothetical protein